MNSKRAKNLRRKAHILYINANEKTKQHITERRVYKLVKKEYKKELKNVK